MSNFLNKIPVSPITSFGNPSVPNGATFGTNFSILQTGGYMEVYSLSGLTYTIPPATTGIIEFSGNSIPIQLSKGSGSVFSPDVLTLNSDNISSGRRKLGMLVYVYETKKIYQYNIDNYDTLWNNATGATGPGGSTVVISDYGTTVKNNSAAGIALINAWTASTISGIGGYNDTNASWRVLSTGGSGGGDFTGGTVTGATIFTNGLTANTISATTYQNLPATPFLPLSGGTVTGATNFTNGLTANTISATTYQNLPTDIRVTGGTYSGNTIIFTNNTGGTFNVTGITTSSAFTGGTVTGATNFTGGLTANTISATTYQNLPIDIRVTGGTYSYTAGTATYRNNTGGTFSVSGFSKMLWYAENSTSPTVSPTSVGLGSIVFGDGATSSGSDSFVFGSGATSNGNNLNVFGVNAGKDSNSPNNSNFFGVNAGKSSYQPSHSNFFGESAGESSYGPQYSNFLGYQAGLSAYQADNSNFLGQRAGSSAQYAEYSNFFGYQAGSGITGNNNIIIGTNITLPSGTSNAINLGNVLFGINTYSGITGTTNSSPTIDGKIGIGVITPLERLHVSGNTRVDGGLSATTISATTYLNLPNTSFIRRHSFTNFDGSNSYDYNGYAPQGSSESSNVWTITRLTINAFGSVTKGVATNVAWTDRVTVIYT